MMRKLITKNLKKWNLGKTVFNCPLAKLWLG
jgi:hypothetical protein